MSFLHCQNLSAVPAPEERCFAIKGDHVLLRTDSPAAGPAFPTVAALGNTFGTPLHIGRLDDRAIWAVPVGQPDAVAPAGCEWREMRALLAGLPAGEFQALACARELLWWDARNRFCGSCGAPLSPVAHERARQCPACRTLFYPGASPAVIVAVLRDDQILLAHNRNFRPGLFSLLAGFVDPGETLEQAAAREIREEVGISVRDLRYVASQPWPFPNSLMVAFQATYAGGDLHVDGHEIEQAGWFTKDALPTIPNPGTVARAMIDRWIATL